MNKFANPVLFKELKAKMREHKFAVVISLYLAIIIGVAAFVISTSKGDLLVSALSADKPSRIYSYLSAIQFVLILFIAPALTTGSISGEKERQTLDILLSTRLSAISIILGKLFSSLGQIILLLVASLPIFLVVFLFGGITVGNVLMLFLYYIITSMALCAVGIFFSVYLKRSSLSNIAAFGLTIFLCIGTILAADMYISYYASNIGGKTNGGLNILYSNPLTGFGSLISEQLGIPDKFSIPNIPFSLIPSSLSLSLNSKMIAQWQGNMIFNIALTVLLVLLSAVKLKPVKWGKVKYVIGLFSRIGRK